MFPPDHPTIRAALIGAGVFFLLIARQQAGYSRGAVDHRAHVAQTLAALAGACFGVALAPW